MSEKTTQLEPGVLSGVTKPTITKIRKTNIVTVEALATQTPTQLAKDADIGLDTATNAITKARAHLHSGFITGDQLLDKLSHRTRLTTGSKAVDKILGGGIESETTTEIAGVNGVGKTQMCLLAGTKILTKVGIKKIEDVNVGDFVLTHMGQFRKVIEVMERDYDGDIYKLETYYHNNPLYITPEHPLLLTTNEWVPIKNLKKGTSLPLPKVFLNESKEIFIPTKYRDKKGLPKKREMSYIRNQGKSQDGQIRFSIENEVYRADFSELMKKIFGLTKYSEYGSNTSKCITLNYSSKNVAHLIRGLCGRKSENKKIPHEILGSPHVYEELLIGLFRGDGCKYDDRRTIEYTTKSETLAYQIHIILNTMNIKNSILSRKGGFRILITGLSWDKLRKIIYPNYDVEGNRAPYDFCLNATTKIKKIQKQLYNGKVYNLEVEKDLSYVANGIIVHNCHEFAIDAQQPIEQGGLDGNVAWVDTEGTFRPERILEMCQNRGLDGETILKGIYHGLARSTDEQKDLIQQLYSLCPENNVKLIIVDSMIGHLRGEYLGRGNLSPRQNELGSMLQTLMKVAQSTKATVIYTNQMISNPDPYKKSLSPTGGNIMGHAASTRVEIRKARQDKRILTLTKSPYLPNAEAVFRITPTGIEDDAKYESSEDEQNEDT